MIRHIIETDIASSEKLGLVKIDGDTIQATQEGVIYVKPELLEEVKKAKEDILILDKKIDDNIEQVNTSIEELSFSTNNKMVELNSKIKESNEELNTIIERTQEVLTVIIKNTEDLSKEIDLFDSKLQENKEDVSLIIKELSDRIDAIEAITEMEELAKELQTIKTTIAVLTDGLEKIEERVLSLEAQFEEFIKQSKNAKMFGLKGDGIANETDAMRKLLKGAGKIYFPEGEYHIYGAIPIYSNTEIVLHPNATIVRKSNGSMFVTYTTTETTGYNGVQNVTISGGTLVHNGSSVAGNLFSVFHANGFTVRDMILKDVVTGHCFDLVGSTNINILNNKFLGCIQQPDATYREAIQIDAATSKSYGIYDENAIAYDGTPTSNVLVMGNLFDKSENNPGYKNIIGQHGTYELLKGRYNNIKILNNTMIGEPLIGDSDLEFGYAIRLIQMQDVIIMGNLIKNFKTFVFADTGATVYTKNGAKIRGGELPLPTRADMDNSLNLGSKNVIIKGNIIHCMDTTRTRPAIWVNSSDLVLAQNSFPVHQNFVIDGNTIINSGTTTSVMYFDIEAIEGCSITNNMVFGQNNNKEIGVKMSKGCKDIKTYGNNFSGITESKKFVIASGLENIQIDSRYVEVFKGSAYAKGNIITLSENISNFDILVFHLSYNGQECRYVDFSKNTTQSIRVSNLANTEGESATPTFGFIEYNLKKTSENTIEILLAKSIEYKISSAGVITPVITFDIEGFAIKSICGIKY